MDFHGLGPGGRHTARRLAPPDLADLQALFERAADYFETATGHPPAPDEAERAFVGGPPTVAVSDKLTIGIFDDADALVGVLDAIPDFPAEGTCTVGLLLLEPAVRGRGIGASALTALEAHMTERGTRRFRTAVVAHHAPGLRFLERQGYRVVSRLEGYEAAVSRPTVVFFEKDARGSATGSSQRESGPSV
jgi:RimJ/RimL family protein N-acetyltransferase